MFSKIIVRNLLDYEIFCNFAPSETEKPAEYGEMGEWLKPPVC